MGILGTYDIEDFYWLRRVKNNRLRYSFFQKHFEVDFARTSDTLCNRATSFDKMIVK